MGCLRKGLALVLILMIAISSLSLLFVNPAFAQTPTPTPTAPFTPKPTQIPIPTPVYPKPAVPEFSLNLIVSPTEVNKTIELTIKNQPFTPYYDASSGWNISFYYNVQIKTNEDNWSGNWSTLYTVDELPTQSNNNYTVFSYPSNQPVDENDYYLGGRLLELPPGTQIDFQVEAMIGYVHRVLQGAYAPYYFVGQESDWSSTQTITIPASSTSASPSQTPLSTPTVPEFSLIALPLILFILSVAVVLRVRRQRIS